MTMPTTVELCEKIRDNGMHCLGAVFRMGPNGDPYCRQCGSRAPGVTYRIGFDPGHETHPKSM